MINVKQTTCKHPKCIARPSFNYIGERKGLYCEKHSKKDMINVIHKSCAYHGCTIRPCFNFPDETRGLYCKKHSDEKMVNVEDKTCQFHGCIKRAYYNHPSEKTKLYCSEHKIKGMVNININKCSHKGCNYIPTHGYPGKRKQVCHEHIIFGMINLDIDNQCSYQNCSNEFMYKIDGQKVCMEHIPSKYDSYLKRLCKWCDIKEDSKFICKECIFRSYKKEWLVVQYLKRNVKTHFTYNSSKMLGGCSKRRPDVYFELLSHCVIVEIDENQHQSYDDICECSRINEIVNGIGGKSVILIRFNPDQIKNGKRIIKISWEKRLEFLVKVVKKEFGKDYGHFCVKLIQLFYNDDCINYRVKKSEYITDLVSV